MIRSMTGFGRGEYTDDISKVTVEIRSVNSRYLDIFVKMPRKYAFAEETVKAAVKERVHRGKVEIGIMVDNIGQSDSDVRLDMELAAKYYDVLSALRDSFDFGDESRVSLSLLSRMPDVIKTSAAEEDEEAVKARLIAATGKALDDFCSMREAEGAKLAADLLARADIVAGLRADIEKRAPEIGKEYAEKFRARVAEILDGVYEVPEERVALEAAIFADKANVTEELVRLDSHVSQLRGFLDHSGDDAIGKKIDFLIQEMNREANTIGSKSNDKEITSMMLDLKAEIEKIREQVQNIE
ncbi:MAG: YicC family protein [Mogibacterium sp.]|nr:YicC family protein [Mogibacterium sp.]